MRPDMTSGSGAGLGSCGLYSVSWPELSRRLAPVLGSVESRSFHREHCTSLPAHTQGDHSLEPIPDLSVCGCLLLSFELIRVDAVVMELTADVMVMDL